MPFKPGNKCACRPDKLTDEGIRRRRRDRSRKWRLTHPPLSPEKKHEYYINSKCKDFTARYVPSIKGAHPIKRGDPYAPSKQKFAWDECPENLLNMEEVR